METVQLQVSVPKEMQDVSKFVQELIAAIKAKKSVSEIVGAELSSLMAAVEGFGAISEEIKSPEASDCIALLGSGVYKALKG